MELTEQVARRLRGHDIQGRTVHLKVRYSNFDTYTRTKSISPATNATNQLWSVAQQLLTFELPDRPLVVRLLGMGVSNLQTKSQFSKVCSLTNRMKKIQELIRLPIRSEIGLDRHHCVAPVPSSTMRNTSRVLAPINCVHVNTAIDHSEGVRQLVFESPGTVTTLRPVHRLSLATFRMQTVEFHNHAR